MQIRTVAVVLALLCGAASAQTVYNQTQPFSCASSDWVCNGVPLNGGGFYNFVSGFSTVQAGDTFVLDVNGEQHQGTITVVNEQPVLRIGSQGELAFTFQTSDGLKGGVDAIVHVVASCHRYCYPMAVLETSAVTVQ